MTDPAQCFLTLPQVAEELATSQAQILAPLRVVTCPRRESGVAGSAVSIRVRLEEYIARCYDETDRRERASEHRGRASRSG